MVFSDLFFLYIFLPAFILLYCISRKIDSNIFKNKIHSKANSLVSNYVLIIFSLFFYSWGEPIYIFLMIGSVFVNYIIGGLITRKKTSSKAALVVGLVFNISVIGVFKYANLLVDTLNLFGNSFERPISEFPIGISFFIFQSMSYLIDVYRRDVPPQRNFFSLLLYISLFPQLIAGPIVRYSTIAEEISTRHISIGDIADGSFRFLVGLGKKVILANQLSVITSQFLDGDLDKLSVGVAWIALIAYTFQIYFDFSGYSDMAIGLGRCMGFHFNENFDHPYISSTITEFWRRWHISLGTFFRDYVYIPLGGNRKHQPFNIMVVWFLTGLWHGASWNFVLWGVYFGIIVMLEKYTILKVKDKIPKFFLHIYSIFLIVFGWALFYFEDFGRLGKFIGILFGNAQAGWDFLAQNTLMGNLVLLIACVVFSLPIKNIVSKLYTKSLDSSGAAGLMCVGKVSCAVVLLLVSTVLLVGNTANPFLYLRT